MNNIYLKLLLEIFILRMKFDYSDDICTCFYNKVYTYLFKSSEEFKPLNESLLHLIAFANNNLERKLLKKFYNFVNDCNSQYN